MSEVALEIIILALLILVNGLLALAEIAIVTARKARLKQQADEGHKGSAIALELANEPSDFLSTVQIGITLVGVLAGAFGGATLAEQIASQLQSVPYLAEYAEAIGVGVVVLAITYFSLVLGELAPKRIALGDPERFAALSAAPMRALARLASPLVQLLSASTNLVLRISGVRPDTGPPVTENEIRVLIDQGTRAGVFVEEEQDMVEAIFRLADRRVDSLLIPRTEIVWLDLEDGKNILRQKIIESNYSQLPVGRGSLDDVCGIVQARDLLSLCLADEPLDLQAAVTEPLFVPESMPVLRVLELFRQKRTHIALVIDEYGGLQGLVTAFDILESIVGDIPEMGEVSEPDVVQREDGSWLVEGRLPIDEFKDIFHIDSLPDEEHGQYQTVGGFVMTYLGRIPTASDHFEFEGWRIEVLDMDGRRVDKVLVVPARLDSPAKPVT